MIYLGCVAVFAVGVFVGVRWANWATGRELKKMMQEFPFLHPGGKA